jgi:4-hydroxy-tetrahydrodipicolinate reductase
MSEKIRVLIAGACGKMGQETARAVSAAPDMEIVGACDTSFVGCNLSDVVAGAPGEIRISDNLAALIDEARPDVTVDFTSPAAVMANVRTSLQRKVPAVVGTTGITQENLRELQELSSKTGTPAVIAPNFAIGAVLMMKFAAEAAKHMPAVEIIELHHDRKLDAPSGTSIKTAEMVSQAKCGMRNAECGIAREGEAPAEPGPRGEDHFGIHIHRREGEAPAEPGPRGEDHFGIHIHSVRLPGLVAHQEVIFGGQGQTLTIRHDSLDRSSFMPGVLLAIRKVRGLTGVVYGLENLL